jgi:hypothetical protein
VPGAGPAQPADSGRALGAGLLQSAHEHGGHGAEAEAGDGGVQPGQHGGRPLRAVEGDATEQAAKLGHVGGGLGVVPDDVADDEHRGAVRLDEDVVPVTADLGLRRRRHVAHRDVEVVGVGRLDSRLCCSVSAARMTLRDRAYRASSRCVRSAVASETCCAVHGSERPWTVSRQRSKDFRGLSRTSSSSRSAIALLCGSPPQSICRTTSLGHHSTY